MPSDLLAIVETELARALRAVDAACSVGSYLEAHLPRGPQGQRAKEAARRARKVRETLLAAGIRLPPLRKVGEYQLPEPDESRPQIAAPPQREPGPPWTLAGLARLAGVSHTTIYRWGLRVDIKGNKILTAAEARAVLRAGGRTALAEQLQDAGE